LAFSILIMAHTHDPQKFGHIDLNII